MKEPSQEEFLKALFHPDFKKTFDIAQRGHITIEELETQFTEFCRKLFNKPELPLLNWMSSNREALEKEDSSIPQMIEAVKKIREKGLKAAVLTNNMSYDKEKIDTMFFCDRSLFDEIIESCVTGLLKPDKEMFEYALKKLDCKPEEVIFLDDFEFTFKGAHELGIKTILVKNPEEAAVELLQLLNTR